MAQRMTPDDRRTQILEAVVAVILDRGAEVTSRELAEAAGVAEGTLYRSFGDKATLLRAVLEHEWHERLAAPELSPADDSVEAFITAAVDVFVSRFALIVALTMALGPLAQRPDERARRRFTELHDELAVAFVPFEARLRINRDAAAELLVSLSFTVASQWAQRPVHATRDDVLAVLLHGLVVDRVAVPGRGVAPVARHGDGAEGAAAPERVRAADAELVLDSEAPL